jgi:hypothetical protein
MQPSGRLDRLRCSTASHLAVLLLVQAASYTKSYTTALVLTFSPKRLSCTLPCSYKDSPDPLLLLRILYLVVLHIYLLPLFCNEICWFEQVLEGRCPGLTSLCKLRLATEACHSVRTGSLVQGLVVPFLSASCQKANQIRTTNSSYAG